VTQVSGQGSDADAAGDVDAGDPAAGDRPWRMELVEAQLVKLWQLLPSAAHLDGNVEALRDEVRFLTSMWQQIRDNDEALQATRHEVHAVQMEKADTRTLHRLIAAIAAVVVFLLAGVGAVWAGVVDVRRVAHQECLAANQRIQTAIQRELSLAKTDVPGTRPTHLDSAAAMQRQLQRCP
jgi:anti-sigma factor RsiW